MPQTATTPCLSLRARGAADMMVDNPVSLRADALLTEAIGILIDRGLHAAPVINDAGEPIGVLSGHDILVHQRQQLSGNEAKPVQVRDLMTPAVFSVPSDATAGRVVEELVALNVHQVFVVDESGVLVGVIPALDVLRHLA